VGKKTPDIREGNPAAVRVAMCQIRTEYWEKEANLERTLSALRVAAAKGAQLAITPENVLDGNPSSGAGDYAQRMRASAEKVSGEVMRRIREECGRLRMGAVVGFAESAPRGRFHNSAALISGSGEILDVYRKVHLRPFEDRTATGLFTAGERFFVRRMPYAGGSFGLGVMICFDREIPETLRCLRALGAQLVACPLATGTSDMSKFIDYADNEMVTRVRAAENELFIAVVNHAGPDYKGGSFAVGPGGELLVQMGPDEGVEAMDVPVGIVEEKFHSKPFGWMGWGYRRQEVYDKYLEAIPRRRTAKRGGGGGGRKKG